MTYEEFLHVINNVKFVDGIASNLEMLDADNERVEATLAGLKTLMNALTGGFVLRIKEAE